MDSTLIIRGYSVKIYCSLCFKEIPEEDMEGDEPKAYCSCDMNWYCCEDHYFDSKEEL